MPYDGASDDYFKALDMINDIFVLIFTLEVVLRISSDGPRRFFAENDNIFDFVIVLLSLTTIFGSLEAGLNFTVFRIFKMIRLLKMIKAFKGLKKVFEAIYKSLLNILNVVLVLFLVGFSFSCAGLQIFAKMPLHGSITKNANFQTFYLATLTLIRASTGEGWDQLMQDCYDFNGAQALIFWLCFIILNSFILINIFVAVIFDGFNENKKDWEE